MDEEPSSTTMPACSFQKNKHHKHDHDENNTNNTEQQHAQKKQRVSSPKKNDDIVDTNSQQDCKHRSNTTTTYIHKKIKDMTSSQPILQLSTSSFPNNNIPSIDPTSQQLLEQILYPLNKNDFLTECFRRKALHVTNRNANDKEVGRKRIKQIVEKYMYNLDVQQILTETSSDNVFLWLQQQQPTTAPDDNKSAAPPLQSIEISDSQTAYALHTSTGQHATYCRAPPLLEQTLVSSMLSQTGMGCGQYDPSESRSATILGRGEVEVFIGTPKHHVTNWHIDFQENFTIQLSGVKKWTLKQSSIKHPLRGVTPHYHSTSDVRESQIKACRLGSSSSNFQFYGRQSLEPNNAYGDEVTILMYPGDTLYFPAGMWHKVETVEYGISINISLMAVNYAHAVCSALEHLLNQKEEWREVVCTVPHDSTFQQQKGGKDGSNAAPPVINKLQRLLSDLPEIVSNFAQDGIGANSILPPALRYPPSFQSVGDAEDDDGESDGNDDNNDGTDDDENNAEEEEQQQDVDVESHNDKEKDVDVESHNDDSTEHKKDDASDDESIDDDEDEIIDIESFQHPQDWSPYPFQYDEKTEDDISKNLYSDDNIYYLAKNPLASLIKMEDITANNEAEAKSSSSKSSASSSMYVLNVNFAGNEVHESAIRVVLREKQQQQQNNSHDDVPILRQCADCELEGGDPAALFVQYDDTKVDGNGDGKEVKGKRKMIQHVPSCLLFYGYLVWAKKEVK